MSNTQPDPLIKKTVRVISLCGVAVRYYPGDLWILEVVRLNSQRGPYREGAAAAKQANLRRTLRRNLNRLLRRFDIVLSKPETEELGLCFRKVSPKTSVFARPRAPAPVGETPESYNEPDSMADSGLQKRQDYIANLYMVDALINADVKDLRR